MKRISLVFVVLMALSPAGPAGGAQTLTVGDVVGMESAEQFEISPDGRWVAWVKTAPVAEKNERIGQVYLSSADGRVTVQLTRGADSSELPRFSPDGDRLAFRSARGKKAKPQVYVLDLRGGEALEVTAAESGVRDYRWLDSRTLIYSAREDSTYRERRLREGKDDTIVVADQENYPPVRLFTVDIESRKARRLTTNDGVVVEFALSPDRRRLVTGENQDIDYRYNDDNPPRQFLIDLEDGSRREVCAGAHVAPYGFQWDARGDGFYCLRRTASDSTDTFVAIETLWYFDVAADSLRPVALGWPRGVGRGFHVFEDGVVVALADGVTDRIARVALSGAATETRLLTTPRPVRLAAASPHNRRVVYLTSNASSLPGVMTATVGGDAFESPRTLTTINPSLEKKTLSETAIVHWAGARGDTVEGILYYPPAWVDTLTYPLVAMIHGGPSGHDPDFFTERWSNYPHVLAAKGAFVLKVNYHGSGNYGLEWLESIRGHYYELEVPDIMAGIDYLVATGLADSTRLGIMGWSNGSILAIQCSLESNRFRALCAGAGDVNWTSDYGNCAFGAGFDDAYFGGPPWELPQVYVDKSPLFRMQEVETPTLILFGANDTSVPTEQGWQHFRALQTIGSVPVRFLLFPGTGHGLVKPSHQRRKMEEELAWFDRHLFDGTPSPEPVVAASSPLAREIDKIDVERVGHLYGVEKDATLLPEVVASAGIRVGRFEVTRAQFAAFDPNYSYPAGTDNHPVAEVSLPLAQAYCLWLSQRTGARYRLPTTAEFDSLAATARRSGTAENTLEYWTGYAPTPDERGAITSRVEALEAVRNLLEPVGSFAASSGIYDLGGNVAEWVIDASGQGVIRGGSAITPADERGGYERPPLGYVGFRVVREE